MIISGGGSVAAGITFAGLAGSATPGLSALVQNSLGGAVWYLLTSAAVYRALDAPSGYIRVHGFEPLQQEQMIVQYVEAHGQITRNQAAELCGLSPDQASRVLRRLVSADKLGQQGENKERVYVPPVKPAGE